MKSALAVAVSAFAVLLSGCGGDEEELRPEQKDYSVVQEGAGGAATSTILGAGAPGTMPPLTGTNADTTTAFTLPTTTDTTMSGPPGTIAGTFTTSSPSAGSSQPTSRRRPQAPAPVPAPPPPSSTYDPAPTPPPVPVPQPSEPEDEEREPEPAPEPSPERQPEPPPPPQPQPQPPPPQPPPPPTESDAAGSGVPETARD